MSKHNIAWGGAGLIPPMDDNENSLRVEESFFDIMSEELARNMQEIENDKLKNKLPLTPTSSPYKADQKSGDTSNDLFIAQMLQQEFDKEHDLQINRDEKFFNKNSHVAISFDNYKVCPKMHYSDSEDETLDFDDDNRILDSFEARKLTDPIIPPCGYARCDNKIITKHDSKIVGRKNAERIMNLHPGVNTGDGGSFNMQLPNRVFNELKSNSKTKRKATKEKGDKATSDLALDKNIRILLLKLFNNGVLSVGSPIAVGKESVVYHANGGVYNDTLLAPHCAVKIFKTCLSDFKTRERYIKCDDKCKSKISKNNTKKTIHMWAEKECHNLNLLTKAGIPCPTPFFVKDNVLVMSFVGDSQQAARTLKQIQLSFADWCIAYEQVIDALTRMYRECKLVHADLSEYNILWHDEKCWIIDMGQSVAPNCRDAFKFLLRDCTQIVTFFASKSIPDIPTPVELFNTITGFGIPNVEDADISSLIDKKVNNFRRKNSKLTDEYNFDFLWNETEREKRGEENRTE